MTKQGADLADRADPTRANACGASDSGRSANFVEPAPAVRVLGIADQADHETPMHGPAGDTHHERDSRPVVRAVHEVRAEMSNAAEVEPLLAELADVADRWVRGVAYIGATGNRGPAVQARFEQLINRAVEVAGAIEAIAAGASAELFEIILTTDEPGLQLVEPN